MSGSKMMNFGKSRATTRSEELSLVTVEAAAQAASVWALAMDPEAEPAKVTV